MPSYSLFTTFIFVLGLSLLTSAAQAEPEQGAKAHTEQTPRPNVLLLLFDDMRFDSFSYRDGPVPTPNIDALANAGTRFDSALTTTGLCSPSRAALFTGRWGHKTGLDDNVGLYHSRLSELDVSEGGLIKRASSAGYEVGYVGKWHLGPRGTVLRGATYTWGKEHQSDEHVRPWTPYEKVAKIKGYGRGERDAKGEKHEYYQTLEGSYEDTPTAEKVRAGQAMLRKAASAERPFFGVISFDQPHPQYRVPEPYASMFDPSKIEVPANHLIERTNKPMAQDGIWWPWHDVEHMTDSDWRHARAFYYGAIAMVDHAVGQVIDTAKELGMYDDLHIVLLGDQGSMLGEHSLYDKGPYAYDELMRIPLIIRSPELEPAVVNRQVSIIDVAPTLAELMSLKGDDSTDGRSLVPLMRKGDAAAAGPSDATLYAYEWYNGSWFGIRAIRTPEMKYVWNPGDSRDELYDLVNDPQESKNLISNPDYAKQHRRLLKLMEDELDRIGDPSLKKFRSQVKLPNAAQANVK